MDRFYAGNTASQWPPTRGGEDGMMSGGPQPNDNLNGAGVAQVSIARKLLPTRAAHTLPNRNHTTAKRRDKTKSEVA